MNNRLPSPPPVVTGCEVSGLLMRFNAAQVCYNVSTSASRTLPFLKIIGEGAIHGKCIENFVALSTRAAQACELDHVMHPLHKLYFVPRDEHQKLWLAHVTSPHYNDEHSNTK